MPVQPDHEMAIEIRALRTDAELTQCVELQELTWGRGFNEKTPASLLRSALRVGGLLAAAFEPADCMVGFVFGFTGVRAGRPIHWSDMMAVRPGLRDSGIGERLKRFQRETLLRQGVTLAEWTFDPLESRNAWLNFARFGGIAREYTRDFYGESDSALHRGLATDRLIVQWPLEDDRVTRRLDRRDALPAPSDVANTPVINPLRDPARSLRCAEPALDLDGPRLLIAIPTDIQQLKQQNAEAAAEWRAGTRLAFEHYLARGFVVMDVVRAADWSAYVLERGPQP